MADILEYFNTINIDVAKRKYYNVNKVNAVLEELKAQAIELVNENNKLKTEIEELKNSQKQSALSLEQTEILYRDTLLKAHERADTMIREAEKNSVIMTQEAEQKAGYAVKELNTCVQAILEREEQNIAFLNGRLAEFKKALSSHCPGDWNAENEELKRNQESLQGSDPGRPAGPKKENPYDEKYFKPKEESDNEELRALEMKISRLAREISALENGI